ncbi:C4-dicarboxylate ABC transporter [Roseovarius spongiae]|uniref:C4-dicarboxylate ABC transporter n=1 Tax=Roseovarius spongiae TaxID=2320272 RepID=A0A3A8ATB5_9RHOB|nr:C4-dicarboxylate TRAP transporter substrate-binding protein [Roseovarius spongiae]RKF12668.1 C4-dicarboxylate ABC transporter [Roseovarius spongiae]
MNKRSVGTLSALAATAAFFATSGIAAADDVVEFNASAWLPATHPLSKHSYVEWLPRLEAASNGTLKPTLFTGPVLLAPGEHLSGIRDGIAQIGYHAGTYTPSDIPEDNVLAQVAFGASDPFPAAFAITEANMTLPQLQQQWKDNNIAYLGGYATSPYVLLCSSKIETLADMKGKKVRVPGAAQSDWLASVGGVPVNVPSSEMYDGLDKGQLDCAAISAIDLKSRSLWDVADHVTLVNLGLYWSGYSQGANRDFWQSLSDDQRQAFFDTLPEAMIDETIQYTDGDAEALAEAPDHGVTVITPADDLTKSVNDFADVVRGNAVKLGSDTFGLDDPDKLISGFEAIMAKWEDRLEGVDRDDRDALVEIARKELFGKVDASTYSMD